MRVWKHAMDVSILYTESEHEESETQIHPQSGTAPWTSVRVGPWAFSIHSLGKKRQQIRANPKICNVLLVSDSRWLKQKGKPRLPFRFFWVSCSLHWQSCTKFAHNKLSEYNAVVFALLVLAKFACVIQTKSLFIESCKATKSKKILAFLYCFFIIWWEKNQFIKPDSHEILY